VGGRGGVNRFDALGEGRNAALFFEAVVAHKPRTHSREVVVITVLDRCTLHRVVIRHGAQQRVEAVFHEHLCVFVQLHLVCGQEGPLLYIYVFMHIHKGICIYVNVLHTCNYIFTCYRNPCLKFSRHIALASCVFS